jgi:hypothetical protein
MKAKWALLILTSLLFAGCAKDPDFEPPSYDNTYLHIVGGSNLVDSFAVVFDYYNADDVVIGKFWHLKQWPSRGYADLTAAGTPDEFGNGKLYLHTIKYNSPVAGENDTLINKKDFIMLGEERSTLCFADSSGEMIMVKFLDEYGVPATDMINVRFINLMETVNSASLTESGGINIGGIGPRNASSFVQFPEGIHNLQAINDGNGAPISSINVDLYKGGTYTFFISSSGTLSYFEN